MNFSKACSDVRDFIINPSKRFGYLTELEFTDRMSDEEFLKKKFKLKLGYDLNLENPTTFNEKLQWLKLHDRKPEYTMMVDKYKVRKYIADKLGEEYLIPLIGVWDNPDQIHFEELPNQFVLKCNHNSGLGMCICKDKSKLDVQKTKRNLWKGIKENYYLKSREWPYKDVPRKIICEKYMESVQTSALTDYKVHCFNGEPKLILVCSNRFRDLHEDFFDTRWNKLEIRRPDQPVSVTPIPKPSKLELMLQLSKKLSAGYTFMRVDFYEISGRPYFGEITLYPAGGFSKFEPGGWDEKLGSWLKLTAKKVIDKS